MQTKFTYNPLVIRAPMCHRNINKIKKKRGGWVGGKGREKECQSHNICLSVVSQLAVQKPPHGTNSQEKEDFKKLKTLIFTGTRSRSSSVKNALHEQWRNASVSETAFSTSPLLRKSYEQQVLTFPWQDWESFCHRMKSIAKSTWCRSAVGIHLDS